MSTLDTKSFGQIVETIAAGMQGRINAFLNFVIGTWLRAIAEAYAGVCLWLQKEALDIAKRTRLATSYGDDADSFIADFPLSGVTRLGAQAATGLCTFARYTASAAAIYVPVGAQVRTQDGTQTFQVYADSTNPAFSLAYVPQGATVATGGYLIPPSVSSVNAPVQALVAGSAGNVATGSIVLIASAVPGVDTVTNASSFTNGIDIESDDSLKSRFGLAVQGRGGGTVPAIQSAIANLKVGMSCVVMENADLDGTTDPGMVSVIVDDGSGNISSDLLTAAQIAVDSVRAAGIRTATYAATIATANIVMTISTKTGYYHPTVVAQVAAAVALAVNGLGQNTTLPYFLPAATALAVPGIAEVLSYALNGGAADMAGTQQTTIKVGALTVS